MSIQRYRSRTTGETGTENLGQSSTIQFPYCIYGSPYTSFVNRSVSLYENCLDWLNPGPPYKVGYDFLLKRKTATHIYSDDVNVRAYFYKYEGKFRITAKSDDLVDAAFSGYAPTAGSYGAQAINKMRPVQPRMGLGQALGELKDFPSLFKVQLRKFKDLGSNYLNYAFGWRPFIKDLLDVIDFQKKLEKNVSFIRKNNNKWIRRHCVIRDETTTTVSEKSSVSPSLATQLLWPYPAGGTPKVTRTLIVKDRVWAEGVMKFYIRNLHLDKAESVWTSPLIRKLSGLEITPSLLWELAPWSWLTDWFSNMGDLYSNVTNQCYDNLVTKYAYVMRHRSTSAVYTATVATRMNPPICEGGRVTGYTPAYPGPVVNVRALFTAECKERAQAAWWGIGNSAGPALSDHQLSILLALGLQRA